MSSMRPRIRATDQAHQDSIRKTKLDEKLYRRMVQLGMTQQGLSQKSGVSDSEISRLLNGQSKRPGLHNILRLARALDVSLDYLADDDAATDPRPPSAQELSPVEREMVERVRSLGFREVEMLLDAIRILGFDLAIRRLYGLEARADAEPASGAPERG